MRMSIFYSVNSGVYLWDGKSGVLVDGLHHGPEVGFSETPPILCKQLLRQEGLFAHLDGLLFTHLHPDHYDRQRMLQRCNFRTLRWSMVRGLSRQPRRRGRYSPRRRPFPQAVSACWQ